MADACGLHEIQQLVLRRVCEGMDIVNAVAGGATPQHADISESDSGAESSCKTVQY